MGFLSEKLDSGRPNNVENTNTTEDFFEIEGNMKSALGEKT
jgi:hypothetical protein